MKLSNLPIPELKKEIQRLMKNITRRVSNIEKIQGRETPATQAFKQSLEYGARGKDFKGDYPHARVRKIYSSIRGLTEKQLRSQYRNLKYYEGLKTLSVKGAINFHKNVGPIFEKMRSQPGQEDAIFSLYSKAVEENGLLSKYKYEVFDFISDHMVAGESDEEIMKKLRDWFQDLYELGEDDDENIYTSPSLSR